MDPKEKQISIIDNYNLYFHFIDQYLPGGFKVNNRTDPFILKLEEMTEVNNQFFCIFDLIQLQILFTSRRSIDMTGIYLGNDPYYFRYPDENLLLKGNVFSLM